MNLLTDRPKSSRFGMVIATIGFTILFAGFTALGVWQVQRLFWKLDLIEQVTARVEAAPVAAPAPDIPISRADDQYRRVHIDGLFDHSKETLVMAVTELGSGFWVLTPMTVDRGFTVLVNRGFVTPEKADPLTRPDSLVQTRQSVTGLLRITEPDGGFLRSNDPDQDRWFSRDVEAIRQAKGLGDAVAPYFIDAGPSELEWPRGGMTVVHFKNTHLVYALTWFGLAGMSLFGYWLFLRELRRRRVQA